MGKVFMDDDYTGYWCQSPYKFEDRSEIFKKWYAKPYSGWISVLGRRDSRIKHYLDSYVPKDVTIEQLIEERGYVGKQRLSINEQE